MKFNSQKPDLLFLCQRIPYPPNKGDKITTFNILSRLSQVANIHLGCFYDDPNDGQFVQHLDEWCVDSRIELLDSRFAKLRALPNLAFRGSLSEKYFFSRTLNDWISQKLNNRTIERVFVYSSAMMQYIPEGRFSLAQSVCHFADMDSDKWSQYASKVTWPKSWVYKREGNTLLAFERKHASKFGSIGFVAERESELFGQLIPEMSGRSRIYCNGIDPVFFNHLADYETPFENFTKNIVFTGAMDYFPNEEAVIWFATKVFPRLSAPDENIRFYIVGSNPSSAVKRLQEIPNVIVTGRVPDVRPFVALADLSVAPMLTARGIQNKVIESLALGTEVLATPLTIDGLKEKTASFVYSAQSPEQMIQRATEILGRDYSDVESRQTRRQLLNRTIMADYSWDSTMTEVLRDLQLSPAKN